MDHDRLSGPNVISVPTALHDVTPGPPGRGGQGLARAADAAQPAADRRAAGGFEPSQPFTAQAAAPLIDGLLAAAPRRPARGLAITPSRRTPDEVKAAFAARFAGDPDVFQWDMRGDNPYRGILALSDRLVVTSDSVSMISEALATPHPVEVFGPDGGRRHAKFLHGLVDKGLVRRFTGEPTPPAPGGPIDATEMAAQAVRRLLQAGRTGSSG